MEIQGNVMAQCMQNLADRVPQGNRETYEKDGELYCKICGKRKTVKIENPFTHKIEIKPCACKCDTKEIEEFEERHRREEEQRKLDKLIKSSMLGERYKGIAFKDTETGFNDVFDKTLLRCRKYTQISSEALKNGYGLYLFGNSGSGKTHLTACMANELLKQHKQVLFTNFFEISSAIRNTFKKSATEEGLIDRIANVDFLFLDDLGTERVVKEGEDLWMQEKMYEVINKRYNEKKPTIFTSNYSLQELVEDRGLMQKTVDRILEMSTVILKLEGPSYRMRQRKSQLPF